MFNKIIEFLLPGRSTAFTEIFSGLTVALALIPEAIAFALVAHVQPQVGLYAAFFMCLITALFGGRPGMISGATGAMAVVMVALVEGHGLDYLFAAVILTGILQLTTGLLGLGKLIRMMPKSVMVGFVNGLAIVIFIAQLSQFQYEVSPGHYAWLPHHSLAVMMGLVLLSMLFTWVTPQISKAIPGALLAIVAVTVISQILKLDTRTVQDMLQGTSVSGGFPALYIPSVPLTWNTLNIILPYSAILCIIGLSESLMTLSLIDEITHSKGKGNKECIAQGLGNIVSGFFKSMGGCAMIGQSMINVTSGGIGRLSGICAASFLLLFLLAGWSIIQQIPLAALVGVMFMVVIGTFEWTTFNILNKVPRHDALVIILVTTITVFTNLAIAVLAGIVIASLVFAWETAKHIYADTVIMPGGEKRYTVHGPLFFGSINQFKELFDTENDPQVIIVDFKHSRIADHSALDAINALAGKYLNTGKKIQLLNLNPGCFKTMQKASNKLISPSIELI